MMLGLGFMAILKKVSLKNISGMNFFSKVEPVAREWRIAGRSDFSRISDT